MKGVGMIIKHISSKKETFGKCLQKMVKKIFCVGATRRELIAQSSHLCIYSYDVLLVGGID